MTTPFSKQIDPIILDMAARPCGVALAEVPHDQPNNDAVGCRMAKMVKRGLLVSEKIGNNKRYFTNADAATAALKAHQAKVQPVDHLVSAAMPKWSTLTRPSTHAARILSRVTRPLLFRIAG